MSVYYPEETPSLGNTKVKIVLAVPDPTAPSLATDINATTSVDVSLTFNDWNPTVNVNSGTTMRRLGEREQFPEEGLDQYQPIEVMYPYDPQADDTDPNNKAKATLTQGAVVDAIVRKGIDINTDFVVADKTETWEVRCGRQDRVRSTDDEFGIYVIRQMLYPRRKEGYGTVVA